MAEKHVIFLGAGASYSSGYPLANELRLLLASSQRLQESMLKIAPGQGDRIHAALGSWKQHQTTLDLFRYGGFSSVDEFCKLARRNNESAEILKRLMRFALCLHNPEERFHESDYYRFLQKLFVADTPELRSDVVVLSYNYDPYLEFLVGRAFCHRWRTHHVGENPPPDVLNAIHSGLLDRKAGVGDQNGFCILKLHGSVAIPNEHAPQRVLNHRMLFLDCTGADRWDRINTCNGNQKEDVPLFFPWEIINDEGQMCRGDDGTWCGVWERAKREVMQATKISFVGMSAHPYLQGGLNFLFRDKVGHFQFVFANTDNKRFADLRGSDAMLRSFTPAGRLYEMLYAASGKKIQPKPSIKDTQQDPGPEYPRVTYRDSFEDFIHWEV